MNDKSRYGEQIITGICVGAWMNVGKKDTGDKFSSGKYSATLLIDKTDQDTLEAITESIKDVAQVKELKELKKHPLIDDDGEMRDGDAPHCQKYDGYAGRVYFQVTSKDRPDCYVLDGDEAEEIVDSEEIEELFYSGAKYRFMLLPHYFERTEKGKLHRCVTFYLRGVLKVQDDKKLGGKKVDTKQAFLSSMGIKPRVKKPVPVEEKVEEPVIEEEVVEETVEEAPVKKVRQKKATSNQSIMDILS